MPNAEIIAIGTELVLGQIVDTNTCYIANKLNKIGVDIFRTSMVGDNTRRIAEDIQRSMQRADIVITTGGLGPTVDDPTREAVALAFNTNLKFHEQLWHQIKERFKSFGKIPTKNNKRQAYLPHGGRAIENPVGTAPAFYMEDGDKIVICLPGVPHEMKHLIQNNVEGILKKKYELGNVIFTRVVHTIGIGESTLDEVIGDLEERENPTVGLAAHPGQVDIRITAKAKTEKDANSLIKPITQDLEKRLGWHILGSDEVSLERALIGFLKRSKLKVDFEYSASLKQLKKIFKGITVFNSIKTSGLLSNANEDEVLSLYNEKNGDNRILLLLQSGESQEEIQLHLLFKDRIFTKKIRMVNRENILERWLINSILGYIWQILHEEKD